MITGCPGVNTTITIAISNLPWKCDNAVGILRIDFFTIASIEATLGCIVNTIIVAIAISNECV
jgi:hypothetical protein